MNRSYLCSRAAILALPFATAGALLTDTEYSRAQPDLTNQTSTEEFGPECVGIETTTVPLCDHSEYGEISWQYSYFFSERLRIYDIDDHEVCQIEVNVVRAMNQCLGSGLISDGMTVAGLLQLVGTAWRDRHALNRADKIYRRAFSFWADLYLMDPESKGPEIALFKDWLDMWVINRDLAQAKAIIVEHLSRARKRYAENPSSANADNLKVFLQIASERLLVLGLQEQASALENEAKGIKVEYAQ